MRHLFTLALCAFLSLYAYSQQQNALQIAKDHLHQKLTDWQLSEQDIEDLGVSDHYVASHNQSVNIYFIQRLNQIDIYNAVTNVHLNKHNRVVHSGSRFIADIHSKAANFVPTVSPAKAVEAVASHLGHSFKAEELSADRASNSFVFKKGNISHVDIPARLKYFLMPDNTLRLVWDIELDEVEGTDYWSIRVDAENLELVDISSYTVKCFLPDGVYHQHAAACFSGDNDHTVNMQSFLTLQKEEGKKAHMFASGRATYNVFPLPVESPAHGGRDLVEDQYNPVGSPYGWHDTNGVEGPEFTITRGNNVNAWPARDGQTTPGGHPNGGPDLVFDFPFVPNDEPQASLEAATVNLFYANNMMHDITYAYGFDEVSGNFQQNNYDKGGRAGDQVNALAQFGANTGQNVNNADFSTPADGSSGRMRMFVWNRAGQGLLTVLEPESAARRYDTGFADFGARVNEIPVIGRVVQARDNSGQPLLACNPIANASEVEGNIAMVDRGSCFFIQKTVNVQNAGARGIIICNFENSIINMAPGEGFPDPTIPAVMLSSSDCVTLKRLIEEGVEVIVSFVNEDTDGPLQLDGTLDNGIVAHEYGHGISNRLTGGPSLSGCLGNDEQMGEGWSDFFSLITSVRPGDDGTNPRGIGTFVLSQPNSGRGIRRFPYSTNMSINPLTYDDIIGTAAPHPLGEVWVAMLWDLYWAMVDKYGYDEDIINGNGGNNKAIQLVMDGMRFQVCGPGFVDGRNAILAADEVNYDGANQCLIWEVFARRGLGYSSSQGAANNRNDGLEGYDIYPPCYNQIKISKKMSEFIVAGDDIQISLEVGNYVPQTSSGVVVTDEIPAGTTYKPGSASVPVSVQGNLLVFNVGDMGANEVIEITYELETDERLGSRRIFFDDFETEDSEFNWEFESVTGFDIWEIAEDMPYQGDFSMVIYDSGAQDQGFYNFDPIRVNGSQPVLRFFHDYETQPAFDAGIIEISTDGGNSWILGEPYVIKNGYRGRVDYNTFTLPNLRGFWGKSDGFVQTLLDLSSFTGQDIHVKFRYGTNATGSVRLVHWSVDNVEIMDAFFYNGEACVTANGQSGECVVAEGRGTLVESGDFTSVRNSERNPMDVSLFPNPSSGNLNIHFRNLDAGQVQVELLSLDGKLIQQAQQFTGSGALNMVLNLNQLADGIYLVKMTTGNAVNVEKVILRR